MTEKFLDGVYDLKSADDTKALYKDWANTYDDEVKDNGYSSPLRTAQALDRCGVSKATTVIDIGCGSGISGHYLKEVGFKTIIGSDFSQEMLDLAKQKNIYYQLHLADFTNPFEFVKEAPHIVTAVGVMAPGHAQSSLITDVYDLLEIGGLFAFSLNDHTLDDPSYMERINLLIHERKIRIRWQEYGDHLPKIGLNSFIMVLEKLK